MSISADTELDSENFAEPRRTWTVYDQSLDTKPSMRRTMTTDPFGSLPSRTSFGTRLSLSGKRASSFRPRPTAEKKLCDFCRDSIFAADEKWGMHHSSFETLLISKEGDCRLCTQLFEDVNYIADPDALIWPLYRWTIRHPQRIENSEEVYAAVVFRQAISLQRSDQTKEDPEVNLPERIFLLFQQSDPEKMQPLHDLGDSTFSPETQRRMQKWLSDCDRDHLDCQGRADPDFMPTRLVDLNRWPRVYCVETRPQNISEPYMTLSYSWGVEKDKFPKTVQDAFQITRALGVRYIWIDSLCIIQGPGGDFMYEGALMLQVYRNSFCNIAAADSTSAQSGIPRPRDPEGLLDAEFQGRPNSTIFGNSIWRVVPKALWDEQVLSAALNTRGWVFQERLLSPRLMHFTRTQVFWDCATISACETYPDGLPQPLDTGSTDRYWRWKLQDSSELNNFLPTVIDPSLEQFWRSAVRIYTGCQLSFGGDKLMAIWGIAGFLISALKETYGVGLWERNLEEQLAWHVVPGATLGRSSRPLPLRAPTWAWASIDAVVELPDRFAAVRDYQVADHDGHRIAFTLANFQQNVERRGPRTWREQLEEYGHRLKKLDEIRQASIISNQPRAIALEVEAKPSQPEFGAMPTLLTNNIKLHGHIGLAYMAKVRSETGWTLILPLLPSSGANIEVFPDTEPKDGLEEEIRFLLLAMNKIQSVDPLGDSKRDGQTNNLPETYEGIGLIIESAPTQGHYYRTGAFRFSGVSLVSLQTAFVSHPSELSIDDTYCPRRGFKIALE